MKNTMQPMNQNQNEQQNDAFHKINDASHTTFHYLKIVLRFFLMIAYIIFVSMVLYYGTQSPDVVKCVVFGHEFSLYYSFQVFFDETASFLHGILPLLPNNGIFYERCVRALPGILLTLYNIFSYPYYIKHATPQGKLTDEDSQKASLVIKTIHVMTVLLICAIACDRGRTGPFFERMLERRPITFIQLTMTILMYSAPIILIVYVISAFSLRTASAMYYYMDVKKAITSVFIVIVLLSLWFMCNSFYYFVSEYYWVVILFVVGGIAKNLDFIVIFR